MKHLKPRAPPTVTNGHRALQRSRHNVGKIIPVHMCEAIEGQKFSLIIHSLDAPAPSVFNNHLALFYNDFDQVCAVSIAQLAVITRVQDEEIRLFAGLDGSNLV